jgi:outer membrane protein OmpA-like peptidoglycan-associated protein
MKMRTAFCLLLLIICSLWANAQNLVLDGGFEDIHRLQKGKINPAACTRTWQCPMDNGGGDSYNKKGKGHGSAPSNIFGRQKPHSGNGYGGICVRKKFIEYLETKLSDTLIKDQEYLVEYYISKAERSIGSVKEFGVLFSDKICMGISGIGIPVQPSIENIKKHGFRRKIRWMKFSAIYKAKGGETVLILGYFNHKNVKQFKGYAHYYIDDVSVLPIASNTFLPSTKNINDTAVTQVKSNTLPQFNQSITLKNIFFETYESKLLESSYTELDKLVILLNQYIQTTIAIGGHTDDTGDEIQNRDLSTARAKAVADYLIAKGINSQRIVYKGYGSSKPIASNNSLEGKQLNRRVDFILKNN